MRRLVRTIVQSRSCALSRRPIATHAMSASGQDHRFGRSDRMSALVQDAYTSMTAGTLEKFLITKLTATMLGRTGGAPVMRPWIGAISPRHANLLPASVLLVGAGQGIRRRREAVDLKVLELALLGTDLYRTIQTGWLCRLVETEAQNVDLLVRISKRGIAAIAGSTIPLTECACGSRGQRGCGHRKQDNRREPNLP